MAILARAPPTTRLHRRLKPFLCQPSPAFAGLSASAGWLHLSGNGFSRERNPLLSRAARTEPRPPDTNLGTSATYNIAHCFPSAKAQLWYDCALLTWYVIIYQYGGVPFYRTRSADAAGTTHPAGMGMANHSRARDGRNQRRRHHPLLAPHRRERGKILASSDQSTGLSKANCHCLL